MKWTSGQVSKRLIGKIVIFKAIKSKKMRLISPLGHYTFLFISAQSGWIRKGGPREYHLLCFRSSLTNHTTEKQSLPPLPSIPNTT